MLTIKKKSMNRGENILPLLQQSQQKIYVGS